MRNLEPLLVAVLGLTVAASPARAEPEARPRVVLVAGPVGNRIAVRMRDELTLIGLDVEVVADDAGGAPSDELAVLHGAVAVARVQVGLDRVQIRVRPGFAAQGSDNDTLEVVALDRDGELLALRAVELLRGMLLPLEALRAQRAQDPHLDESGKKPVAPVPVAPIPAAAPPPDRAAAADDKQASRGVAPVRIYVAPALAVSPGGVPATPNILLDVQGFVGWRVFASVHALFPTTAAVVEHPSGTIEIRMMKFGGRADVSITDPESDVGAFVGLGLAAAALFYEGSASRPHESATGSRWLAAPEACAGLRYDLRPWLSARADLTVATLSPTVSIRAVGERAASFGAPLFVPSLGLEVSP